MPINIPQNLPAFQTLSDENVFVMCEELALKQDIRPLEVAIVNLMPTKIETETQLLRLLSNTPLQVNVTFVRTETHLSKNISEEHLSMFYTTFDEIKEKHYDALFITGAPVEKLPFEQVTYWEELCRIMQWSKSHAYSVIHICWGAQAGLYYHYGIEKYPLEKKTFGIFPQKIHVENHPLFKGFDDVFNVPYSIYTENKTEDIKKHPKLTLLASSELSGAYLISDKSGRQIFITGHPEYDRETLKGEYLRDKDKGLDTALPYNYFPDNDPNKEPANSWFAHGSLMYSNWLNFCVYQKITFDITKIEPLVI
ncbi:MAG: homoserine O-succinyltransferase [Oscillospiraceae bacterium]|jgi:homoserine O-succinyltransferase|nr:homoserine O-succinyltransferase [Oscillospiraceae bacterium]